MATTALTAGNDLYNIYIGLKGALGAGAQSAQINNTIDAGAGIDTINIDDTYLGNYALTADATGAVTLTTSSGFVKLVNFETITFKNAGAITLATIGNDTITGTGSADIWLSGGAGNDTINGGVGADYMQGGAGDDTFIVDNVGDRISELAGDGIDTVQSSVTYSLVDTDGAIVQKTGTVTYNTAVNGGNVENLTLTGTAAINGTGNALNNVLIGNSGANILNGGGGNDTIDGGAGTDTYVLSGTSADYTFTSIDATHVQITDNRAGSPDGTDIITNIENIQFGAAAAVALSSLLVAPLTGTTGADTITGTTGADTMVGLAGDDTYTVDNAGDIVTENANEGTDTVNVSINNYTLAANVENLVLLTGVLAGNGNALGNTITGNASDNVIDGGVGADTMIGGAGNDTYVVDNAGDVATETVGGGTDTVQASINYTLGAEVENLVLTGTASTGTGNASANTITGNASANVLDGGIGADTMIGGAGDDTYIVDNAGDATTEVVGGGTDTVQASVNYTLNAEVENLVLTGSALSGSGNALANTITGNASANILDGMGGADIMIGGAGDDTYIVDNFADVTTEVAGGGTDNVQASVSYTLNAEIENLTLTGTAANGTGNALGNTITGNASDNVIDGGVGADTMIGGAGNDTYVVDNAGDVATETVGGGTDTVQASINYTLGAEVENLVLTGTASTGTGNASANTITGNASANVLDGGIGADTMIGGAGDDTYIVDNAGDATTEVVGGGTDTVQASVNYTLNAEVENLVLTGSALSGSGNALANTITGNASANILDGMGGADIMIGGAGDDTYIVDNFADVTTEVAGGGTDNVQASVSYTLNAEIENLTLTGTAANGTGNALGNTITGNASDNVIDGGVGADTMIGGAGNDTFVVDNAGDVATETVGGGTDTVQASINYTLGAEVENLVLTGAALSGTGNASANTITGNASANILDGMGGADTMIGGAGDDTYIVDNFADVTTEAIGGGADTVQASVNYTLNAEVENLTLIGAALSGTGNVLDNVITGNALGNAIDGDAGNDVYVLTGAHTDYIYTMLDATHMQIVDTRAGGGDGTDVITNIELVQFAGGAQFTVAALLTNLVIGGSGGDSLVGSMAGDTLDGGLGADTMAGGLGDDVYIVDNVGDVVVENAGEGIETVQAAVSFALAANVENLTMMGTAASGTGNELANVITGNASDNVIDGGMGADTMIGGAGNDTYYVDNASDMVTENINEGADTVISTVTHTLGLNVEYLTLAGVAAINGTGNTLANTIVGNAAANIIDGGLGLDTMKGGLGNDTYIVSQTTDIVTELLSQGTDLVKSAATFTLGLNVENLTLTGAAVVNGTGNALANTIIGNTAANIITGGLGHDVMTGGLGRDVFDFNLITETTKVAATRDYITDFTHLTDRVDLSTIDANIKLAGNQAFTFLAAKGAAFTGKAGQLHYIAQGANTVIEGDINGDKIADFQIQLNGIKVLTVADFVL
jgi:trimeric autotransporter adhesin